MSQLKSISKLKSKLYSYVNNSSLVAFMIYRDIANFLSITLSSKEVSLDCLKWKFSFFSLLE